MSLTSIFFVCKHFYTGRKKFYNKNCLFDAKVFEFEEFTIGPFFYSSIQPQHTVTGVSGHFKWSGGVINMLWLRISSKLLENFSLKFLKCIFIFVRRLNAREWRYTDWLSYLSTLLCQLPWLFTWNKVQIPLQLATLA